MSDDMGPPRFKRVTDPSPITDMLARKMGPEMSAAITKQAEARADAWRAVAMVAMLVAGFVLLVAPAVVIWAYRGLL